MIRFGSESLAAVWPELLILHRLHWNETEAFRHGQPFAPSLERYEQHERAGWFTMYTARDGAKLIGNLGIYLLPSMHTQQLIATEDTLFLLPEYRSGWIAIRFMRYVEEACWKRGAVQISVTAKNDKVGRLMRHLGYTAIDVVYSVLRKTGADSAIPLTAVTETSHGSARLSADPSSHQDAAG